MNGELIPLRLNELSGGMCCQTHGLLKVVCVLVRFDECREFVERHPPAGFIVSGREAGR